jgi:hypothetical protein
LFTIDPSVESEGSLERIKATEKKNIFIIEEKPEQETNLIEKEQTTQEDTSKQVIKLIKLL